jgi:hypothetical protein
LNRKNKAKDREAVCQLRKSRELVRGTFLKMMTPM